MEDSTFLKIREALFTWYTIMMLYGSVSPHFVMRLAAASGTLLPPLPRKARFKDGNLYSVEI